MGRTDMTRTEAFAIMAQEQSRLSAIGRVSVLSFIDALQASGFGPDAPLETLQAVAPAVMPLFDTVIETVADAIEGVGSAFAIAGALISMAGTYAEAKERAKVQRCQNYLASFPIPQGSGSLIGACTKCPSDVFALLYDSSEHYASAEALAKEGKNPFTPLGTAISGGMWTPPKKVCSYLGQALMRITEGAPFDGPSADVISAINPAGRYDAALNALPFPHNYGVSKTDRERFRRMRLALAASYAAHADGPTDAGISLWPVYLDLLTIQFDSGKLDRIAIEQLLTSYRVPQYSAGSGTVMRTWFGDSVCVPGITGAVLSLVQAWSNTIHPVYEDDKRALRETERQALALSAELTGGILGIERIAIKRRMLERQQSWRTLTTDMRRKILR